MSRRSLGATVVLTLFALSDVSYGAHVTLDRPRANCARRILDDEGDAKYTISGNTKDPRDLSIDPLDITSVTLRHGTPYFEVHLKVKNLGAAYQPYETGYSYEVTFKNDQDAAITFKALTINPVYNAQMVTRPPSATDYPQGYYKIGNGGQVKFTDVSAEFDTAGHWVTWTVPVAEFAKAFPSGAGEGSKLTNIVATSTAWVPGGQGRPADSASSTDPVQDTYVIGDDFCFGPPPASLAMAVTAPTVPYGDPIQLSATLKSEAGADLAGKSVKFAIGNDTIGTDATNSAGVATITYTATKTVGTYPLVVSFAGDTEHGKTKLTGVTLVVVLEQTKFSTLKSTRTSATTRTVETTLTDDDGKVLAAHKVEWYANNKKVATTSTSARGVAKFTGAKIRQTIVAKYAGVNNKYAPSASKPLKV